jgi:opacity protein-like surface antigen
MNKKLAVIVCAALLPPLAAPAFAQTYPPAAAAAAPSSGVKFGGYLSLDYVKGQAESDSPKGNIENLLAGFLAAGQIGQKFGFAIEARSFDVEKFDLDQAWVGFLPSDAFTARVGLYLVPFGTWNVASRPYQTLLIRTPLNLEVLYPASWRDLGLLVQGRIGVLSYAAYVGNGLAEGEEEPLVQQFRDNNTDKAKGGRLGLAFGQAVTAGVSFYTGKYDALDTRDLTLEGADLAWVTDQWEVHGEYTKSFLENPEPFARGESEGFAIWGCMSFRSFQPVGSFQKVKFDDPFHEGGIAIDRSRWTAGLRYVLSSTVFFKFEYDWNKEKGTPLKNDQWQVQAGLSF